MNITFPEIVTRQNMDHLKQLIKSGIKIHVFEGPYEQNEADYTQRILSFTIPVMMDIIRTQIQDRGPDKVPLRIIVEGYNSGPSQWGNVTPFESRYEVYIYNRGDYCS